MRGQKHSHNRMPSSGRKAAGLLQAAGLILFLLGLSGVASAQFMPDEPASPDMVIEGLDPALQPVNSTEALKHSEQSVVRVLVVYRGYGGVPLEAVGMGSGFVIAPGYIVTNYHVIETPPEATSSEIYIVPHKDARTPYRQVKLVRQWVEGDLALLRAEGLKIDPLTLSLTPQKNQRIVAMGYPGVTDRLLKRGGLELLEPADAYVTQGSIALFASTNPDGSRVDTLFHTAPINPGNSGGPLLDECGQVVGVNTWSAASTLSESGDMDVPAGQYVATHVAALNTFLSSAGLKPKTTTEPCYARTADEIVKDDDLSRALAIVQEAQLKRIEEQRKAEQMNALMDQLQLAALVLLSVLVLILIWLIIQRRHHRDRSDMSVPGHPQTHAHPHPHPQTGEAPLTLKKALLEHHRFKPPFPWGWLVLAAGVVLLALGFLFRESPVYQRLTAPRPETIITHPVAALRLSCEVDPEASYRPLSDAGPIEFDFDASRACVNGRTPYERQADGSLLRYTVSDSEPVAAKLELSKDGQTFRRSDYRLEANAYRTYVAQRTALGALRCPTGNDPVQAQALEDNLKKVRFMARGYLTGSPDSQTVWRCKRIDDKPRV